MPYASKAYLQALTRSIEDYQDEHLLSDRELAQVAGMSPTMISKIKQGATVPKMATLRKLRDVGVAVPRPQRPASVLVDE